MRSYLIRALLPIVQVLFLCVLTACANSGDGAQNGQAAPPQNSPPTISGMPNVNVVAGQSYSFVPAASDADGDALSFSIQDMPDWAEFDSTNGALTGVPGTADVGTHAGIGISVSDGTDSASLAAFSIAVADNTGSGPPVATDYIGYGSATSGADSCPGTVETYHVTSLSGGSGTGTIRDAVSADCRLIVFDVAGNIDLGDLQISNSYLTIDGASAPDPGITFVNVGRLVLEASGGLAVHDVIVNNIRAVGRGGPVVVGNDLWELDGSSGAPIYRVVLDHLTMEDAGNGSVDIYGDVHDITLSNSLIKDSIQGHHFSQASGLRERLTIYGNVYARLNERQPRIRYDTRRIEFVGNVIYGWGWHEGGASGMHLNIASGTPSANVENNVYLHVPGLFGSADDALRIDDLRGSWFFSENIWPFGESTGDTALTSSRVNTVYQGIDYAVPRQRADVLNAGSHFKTTEERDLLDEIDQQIQAL